MNEALTKNSGSEPTPPNRFPASWLNYRRLRFWLVLLPLLYTLAGFLLVPLLVNKLVVDNIRESLGREASFTRVQFNPYVLSLKAEGFRVNDTDGEKLAGFDDFFVNLQLSSLFKWALTFREVRLDGLYLLIERFDEGDSRLSRLLADLEANTPARQADDSKSGGLPRLLIHNLDLNKASVGFRDKVPETPVDLDINPIDVSIQQLNTLPDLNGQQSVVIALPGKGTLRWTGSISLAPLKSEGELSIENSSMDQTIAYLKGLLPLESIAATLTLNTQYRLGIESDKGPQLELTDMELQLADVAVSGLDPVSEFLSLASFTVGGGVFHYPEQTVQFATVRISDPKVSASLDENRRLNLLELAPKKQTDAPQSAQKADPSSPGWQFSIDQFVLNGGQVNLTDNSVVPALELGLADLQLTVSELTNQEGEVIPLSIKASPATGGSLGFEGQFSLLPGFSVNGQANAIDIELGTFQPYVAQNLNTLIEAGTLSAEADISLPAGQAFDAKGKLGISQLNVTDSVAQEPLLAWGQLDIDLFELDVATRSVKLSIVDFEQIYGRIKINEDRSMNLTALPVPKDPDSAETDVTIPGENEPWSVTIGGISVNDGSMDFSDFSLPLKFGTKVTALNGKISTIDTRSKEPASIRLEGQVDEYGLARIEGTMSVLDPISHTDISVEFRNLLMSNLSPYTAEFAGQEIAEGKLDLNLGYAIENGQLDGRNKAVLSDLVLGDRVDNPDAVSLPLELAVALLKDADGVIDVDLPVSGNVNDPEFEIGGVIMTAVIGLVTKIVTAPFRLLGSLIGIDSEDLGQFQFLAGRSDLTPPELEKISHLQQALQQRPELGVEITGPFDPAVDTPMLKYFHLRDEVMARLGEDTKGQFDELEMVDVEIRSVLEDLFVERFPDTSLKSLKAENMTAPADNPEAKPELDLLAYSANLRDRLLEAEEITTQELEDLGKARAETIRSAFLASGEFNEDRITLASPAISESADGEWVSTELGVATD